MYCIKVEIPVSLSKIDDDLKAIYHSKDTLCIWVFQTREDRNEFVADTAGMIKAERENHYKEFYI